ncbi:MAG TPA: hypothetical protein VE988_06465 [Gemmataceae bacterium]|nr:hypothetical protein [Gemmataceae bacterium]
MGATPWQHAHPALTRKAQGRAETPGGACTVSLASTTAAARRADIDYMHDNPVQRGLVAKIEDWERSSARWFTAIRPVKIEMVGMVLTELVCDGDLTTVMKRKGIGETSQ